MYFCWLFTVKTGSSPIKHTLPNDTAEQYIGSLNLERVLGYNNVFEEKARLDGGQGAILDNFKSMATPPKSKFSIQQMLAAVNKRGHNI